MIQTAPTHDVSGKERFPQIPAIHEPPTGWARIARAADGFLDLFLIQFSTVRSAWHWIFLVSSATPLGFLFFFSFVFNGSHTSVLPYIVGNVVIALMTTPIFMLAGQFSWARQSKAFDFYAGLPISRTVLIAAAISVSVMFTVPGTIVLMVVGMLVFHLWLVPSPLIVAVVLLSPMALAGVGATVGVLAPNQNVAGVTGNLLTVVIVFLSPVFVPISKLPAILQVSSRLLPTTYATDALRQSLTGHITASFALDLLVLTAFSFASIYLVTARLDWRST